MKTIHKFPLGTFYEWGTAPIFLELPEWATFLHFAFQDETACAWFELYHDSPRIRREFRLVPTGGEVPIAAYLGTAVFSRISLVLHLYEVKK